MKRVWLTTLLFGAACGCLRPMVPPPAIELKLELAGQSIGAGDRLWYRLKLRNIGRKPFRIDDPFWCDQSVLGANEAQTAFVVFDSSAVHRPPYFTISFHSPNQRWTNDSTGHACAGGRLPLWIEPGKSIIPTPTFHDGAEGPIGFRALDIYRHLPRGRYFIKAVYGPRGGGGLPRYESAPTAFEVL